MDGNGYLDEFEIEAMFQHEVNRNSFETFSSFSYL